MVKEVVGSCANEFFHWGSPIIFSNRFTVLEKVVIYEERKFASELGVPWDWVIVPDPDRNQKICHTIEELEFALEQVLYSPGKNKSLLIVAEALHMRRVRLTVRKLLRKRQFREIRIYYKSVRAYHCYGTDTVQRRFLHPAVFFPYELAALVYSKKVGWI